MSVSVSVSLEGESSRTVGTPCPGPSGRHVRLRKHSGVQENLDKTKGGLDLNKKKTKN